MFEHREEWPITVMAPVLHVSPSGYYSWRDKPNSPRHDQDAKYQLVIRKIFDESHQTYGSPRIHQEMLLMGYRVGKKRIERLMREMGIAAVHTRKKKVPRTTTVDPHAQYAPNLLDRDFIAEKPNEKWVGDITYIYTQEKGWCYLATVIDLFSRRVVGWSTSEYIDADLVCDAFKKAILQRGSHEGLLFHSDRGSQYTSKAFRALLGSVNCQQSMSGTGDCYDNAVAESFFHSLKVEWVHLKNYQTHAEAHQSVFHYIEGFYNTHRRHSTINYLSPVEWERQHAA